MIGCLSVVPPCATSQGYEIHLELKAKCKGKTTVELGFFDHLKCQVTGQTHQSVAVVRKLGAQKAGSGGAYDYKMGSSSACRYRAGGDSRGWANVFGKGPINSIDQLSEFIVDGGLKLRYTIVQLDGRVLS